MTDADRVRGYRIVRSTRRSVAWAGGGAALYGGRWNSPGHRAVYAADSLALATLETLIHLESEAQLEQHHWGWIDVPADQVHSLATDALPPNWSSLIPPISTMVLGDQFLIEAHHLALRVPSVVVPESWNFLLNPLHPGFGDLTRSDLAALRLDPRLV